MFPLFVQHSMHCSHPGPEGVIRRTVVAPRQLCHREHEGSRDGERVVCVDIFDLPRDCISLLRGVKLAAKPPCHVAAHGVADHQGSLDTIASWALERAEFVTRWAGRNASQVRAGLAVRTAQTLDCAKRRTGW